MPQNQEYFAIIAADVLGSIYRERRQKACEVIEDAFARGLDPGECGLGDALNHGITSGRG